MQKVVGFLVLFVVALVLLGMCSPSEESTAYRQSESYRLVQASGNTERIVARGLTRWECEARKKDLQAVSDVFGPGSVTCLPESVFND